MKRNQLLGLLATYQGEGSEKERLIEFIKTSPDCFERSNLEGHITASCWLISNDGERVLLTHHKKLNMWLQMGGHCDGDSDVLGVAMKEAREESGINDWETVIDSVFDMDIHLIPGRPSEPEHYHYDVRFLLRASGDETYAVSEESHDIAWVELDRLSEYTEEHSMHRMNDKWKYLKALNH